VYVTLGKAVESSSHGTAYFRLPSLGTTYIPDGFEKLWDLGATQKWYIPHPVTVLLEYRSLKDTEIIEQVSPGTLIEGSLSWGSASASSLKPRGIIGVTG
jgi:hypothetical protein